MVSRLFISYRRDDSAGYAGRLYDRLEQEFGRDNVVMDVDAIPLGADFVEVLGDEVVKCDVLLAIIGSRWLDARDEDGNRRLENPADFVRIEIETALTRDIRVIPILLEGTRIPKADQLPDDLRKLSVRNALNLRHASFFDDMERLIRGLKRVVRHKAKMELKAAEEAEARRKAEEERKAAEEAEAQETREWGLVISSRDKNVIQDFLERWPHSQRAEAARARIAALERKAAEAQAAQPTPAPVIASSDDRYRAEGRIKVDARIIHGAPDGWFLPGNGKVEWFQDHDGGPEMVVVPAGKFMMGSPETEAERSDRESPQHQVTIARPFAIGRHAVTRGQFAAFVNKTGYVLAQGWLAKRLFGTWRNPGFPQDDRHPVVRASWEDAKAFVAWLHSQTGQNYRLLSEAEWEYAARAGTTTPFWWGSTINPAQANYDGNYVYGDGAKGEYREQTVAVGEFAANPWGFYQVHGNVWEWCEDHWHGTYNGARRMARRGCKAATRRLVWLMPTVEKFPRSHKFTIGDRIETARPVSFIATRPADQRQARRRLTKPALSPQARPFTPTSLCRWPRVSPAGMDDRLALDAINDSHSRSWVRWSAPPISLPGARGIACIRRINTAIACRRRRSNRDAPSALRQPID